MHQRQIVPVIISINIFLYIDFITLHGNKLLNSESARYYKKHLYYKQMNSKNDVVGYEKKDHFVQRVIFHYAPKLLRRS